MRNPDFVYRGMIFSAIGALTTSCLDPVDERRNLIPIRVRKLRVKTVVVGKIFQPEVQLFCYGTVNFDRMYPQSECESSPLVEGDPELHRVGVLCPLLHVAAFEERATGGDLGVVKRDAVFTGAADLPLDEGRQGRHVMERAWSSIVGQGACPPVSGGGLSTKLSTTFYFLAPS